LVFTLVLHPLLPDWVRKGDVNPLGLHDCDEPLVIVSFTANWTEVKDDEIVKMITRQVIEKIEAFAAVNGTSHRWSLDFTNFWVWPISTDFDQYVLI
jgi:hypothetical protein